mgnify:CR=1 FL=1
MKVNSYLFLIGLTTRIKFIAVIPQQLLQLNYFTTVRGESAEFTTAVSFDRSSTLDPFNLDLRLGHGVCRGPAGHIHVWTQTVLLQLERLHGPEGNLWLGTGAVVHFSGIVVIIAAVLFLAEDSDLRVGGLWRGRLLVSCILSGTKGWRANLLHSSGSTHALV